MQVSDSQLSDFLFGEGLLPRRELERAAQAARERNESLARTLVHMGLLGEDDVRRTVARSLGIPFMPIHKGSLDAKALELLPEAFCRHHCVIAVGEEGSAVEVALLDIEALPAVQAQLGSARKVLPRLTNRESFTHALLHYQKYLKDLFGTRIANELAQMQQAHQAGDAAAGADAAVRAADALLRHALHQRAREVHLEKKDGGLRVRYKMLDTLSDAFVLPPHAAQPLFARFKTLARMPLSSPTPAAGRFKLAQAGTAPLVRVIVASTPMHGGEALTLSCIVEESGRQGLSLSSLGFTPRSISRTHELFSKRAGVVLVCGSRGAGKTTLLYTLADVLTDASVHIATIESNVRYRLPAVSQMEVREEIGLAPSACVRAQLRHNPDIVLIDCSIDEETALLALQAANRGALVLMAVEADTAEEGIEQLNSMGLPSELVASTLLGAIGVQTAPALCPHGMREQLSRSELRTLEERVDIKTVLDALKEDRILPSHAAWKDTVLYKNGACEDCAQNSAVIGLQEIILNSLVLKDLIRAHADAGALSAQSRGEGALFFAEDALYKAVQGLVPAV